jgi:hypothetical protein
VDCFSITVTLQPAFAIKVAADIPAYPLPITTTLFTTVNYGKNRLK